MSEITNNDKLNHLRSVLMAYEAYDDEKEEIRKPGLCYFNGISANKIYIKHWFIKYLNSKYLEIEYLYLSGYKNKKTKSSLIDKELISYYFFWPREDYKSRIEWLKEQIQIFKTIVDNEQKQN